MESLKNASATKHPCNLKHCDEQMYCIDDEIQNIDKILAGFESIRRSEKRKDTPLITISGPSVVDFLAGATRDSNNLVCSSFRPNYNTLNATFSINMTFKTLVNTCELFIYIRDTTTIFKNVMFLTIANNDISFGYLDIPVSA